ncbi:G-type lectin S-receptor-like serine/threonine-protein kinase LECRK1 [Vicia villosa]|uniref:G-type lectin S-receptor-like serine/threonine-protein kinase LECRK1 n=1 Tax=Vicia villosa TaxID=3911 RepID=UPI00273B7AB9|nr:G-type lectin S-receptor-like serine/threonine-protein kinase LECRK1 [Vicia villosa]
MSISLHVVQSGPTTLFSIFLAILLLPISCNDLDQKYFILVNQCKFRVWPASFSTAQNTTLETNHFSLKMWDRSTVWAPPTWNGHVWGRTLCRTNSATGGNFSCITGDCGTGKQSCDGMRDMPPATLAEFRLGKNGLVFYNVDVVEGFNIPIVVVPIGVSGENVNCSTAGCLTNINNMCAKDNGTNTFTCSTNLYKIIFCPASSMGLFDQSVSVDDSFTAGNGTNQLLSSSREFAFGTLIIVMLIILGFSIAIVITLVGAIFYWYNSKKIKSSTTNKKVVDRNLRIFSFKEITKVTNNFREELGRGSCSIVYKGKVDVDTCVAVKKLDKLFQDSDKEFQTEMNVIIKTHHRNLVRLHGYCSEDQHRILVYELMSNGTLARFLFTPLKPNWNQRVHIIIGIARGLVYLHEECCTQIIHCDIKPQNILLDDDYNAKISDFGLAKLLLINQSHTKTGIRGTKGYVAPDWFRSAPITSKVDTFSFGVLLLEIICSRKNIEDDTVSEEKRILIDWAYDCYKTGRMDILLENEYEADKDMSRFEKFVMISIWCTQEDPSLRPPMKKVLLMLEGIVEVEIPPNPYLYGSSNQS